MIKHTESTSLHNNLEQMSTLEIVEGINTEDKKVAQAVEKVLPQIVPVIDAAAKSMAEGGKLFYIGAGTSGRLGILDASECPPTFGVPFDMVVGLIAGGDAAIRKAVENAEDDTQQAWKDLQDAGIKEGDVLVGIASSGTTPYVIGALQTAQTKGIITSCITCNEGSPVAQFSDFPIEVIVGPEFVTGSTRMKSGTAQKMVLNMISTGAMIKLGRVQDNKMVDMQLSNAKLVERGTKMIAEQQNISLDLAKEKLLKYGNVREALKH